MSPGREQGLQLVQGHLSMMVTKSTAEFTVGLSRPQEMRELHERSPGVFRFNAVKITDLRKDC